MHRAPFLTATRQPQDLNVLEIVVVDLSGKIPQTSLGGSNYYMILLDKREGWRNVFFLRRKSEAANLLIRHDQQTSRRVGNRTFKIQVLRSDNGGEFISKHLEAYLANHGIRHETINPHDHEQVGDVERFVEKSRINAAV